MSMGLGSWDQIFYGTRSLSYFFHLRSTSPLTCLNKCMTCISMGLGWWDWTLLSPFNLYLTFDLPQWVNHLYVHGTMGKSGQILGVVAWKLVCKHDGVLFPVSPVQATFKSGDGKHVRHQVAMTDDCAALAAINSRHVDVVQVAISPENCTGHIIDGQCIWPGQVVLPQKSQNSYRNAKGGCSVTWGKMRSTRQKRKTEAVLSH